MAPISNPKAFILLLGLIFASKCYLGILFNSTTYPSDFYRCYTGYNFRKGTVTILQGQQGYIDESVSQTLANIKSVGMQTDIAFAGCRTVDPEISAYNFMRSITPGLYSKVWIYVYTIYQQLLTQCNWNHYDLYTPEQSCNYLQRLVSAFQSKGIRVGVAATKEGWDKLFQGQCDIFSSYELFSVDGTTQQTFNDFIPYGGWSRPSLKLMEILVIKKTCGNQLPRTYY